MCVNPRKSNVAGFGPPGLSDLARAVRLNSISRVFTERGVEEILCLLWSADLLRCESVTLRTSWVLVVMAQYTRRIVGFAVQAGIVGGRALCRMFKQAIRGQGVPKYLSSDHDPLYRFHQWQANLSVLGVTEIKTVLMFRCRIHLSSD